MSANGSPVPPFEFAALGDFQDSYTYEVPASGEVQPYTSSATFANSSGQAIQPTISLYSQSGNLLARVFPTETVADGDSAEVTWVPPFGSAASSSSPGGSGIQFDVDNEGDWLEVETTGAIPSGTFSGWGTVFNAPNGILLQEKGSGATPGIEVDADTGVTINSDNNNVLLTASSGDVQVVTSTMTVNTTDEISLVAEENIVVTATTSLAFDSATMGFFGHAVNPQPATPTDTASIIAALQSLGLVA